jgi:hypothetical protein
MSRKRYTPEQIIRKLRETEVALAQAQTTAQLCRTLGIADPTFSRWGHKYAGLKVERGKPLKYFFDYLIDPTLITQKAPIYGSYLQSSRRVRYLLVLASYPKEANLPFINFFIKVNE